MARVALPGIIDTAARALALIRSIVAPAEVVRHGPLWILRDVEAQHGRSRREEIFAFGAPPAEIARAVRDYQPRGLYALAPVIGPGEDEAEVKVVYKSLGYRLGFTEPLFVCDLAGRGPVPSPWRISRVTSLEEAKRVSLQVFGKPARKLRAEDLTAPKPQMRLYWVEVDGHAVAAARSLMPGRGVTWLHDVATLPDYRRRGIATALINHILAEDAILGSKRSVLLASLAGSKLYPRLGYRQVALMQIYTPLRKT
jgi:GNAT superfamily N-acetyltransferase